jgi:hypothetical protein
MAALDFPSSPTIGQTYPSPAVAGVPVYTWNGTSWNTSIGPSYMPAGTVTDFFQAAAPTGWTRLTTYDDALIRIVGSASPSSGGTNGFVATFNAQTVVGNTTLTTATTPAHAHALPGGDAGPLQGPNSPQSVYFVQSSGTPNSNNTGSAGSGGAHNHPITTAIKYVDVLLATKN